MATEQPWGSYGPQDILGDNDTVLVGVSGDTAGVRVPGTGFRPRWPSTQRVSAFTLALSDRGSIQYVTAAAFAITVPTDAAVPFPIGTVIRVICEDAVKTIVGAAGVTLALGGTGAGGTKTLAIGAVAELVKVQTNRWFVFGPGVS